MNVIKPMRGRISPVRQTSEYKSPAKSPEGLGKVPQLDSLANVDKVERDCTAHEVSIDRQASESPSRTLRKSTKDLVHIAEPAASPTGVTTRAQKLDKKSLDYNNLAISLPSRKFTGDIPKIRKRVMWTIATRLQLIAAVTKVEEEILLLRSKEGCSRAVGRGVKKWGRVAELLSGEFRVQTRGPMGMIGRFKCKSVFDHLIRGYKDKIGHRNRNSSHALRLTDEEFQMLKRREELKAKFWDTPKKIPKPHFRSHLRSRLRSRIIKQEPESSNEHSGFETEQGGTCSPTEQTSESESDGIFERLPQIDGNFETLERAYIDSKQKVIVIETSDESERLDGSVEKVEGDHDSPEKSMEEKFSCPNLGSATSLSKSEFNGPAQTPPDSKTIVETQARITRARRRDTNLATRRPPSPSVSAERRRTKSSMIEPAYDEDLQNILERLLKRVDQEFSHLSSWMQNEAIPFAERVMSESTGTAMSSAKKRKVNAQRPPGRSVTEAFEGLMKDSSMNLTDHQIRALFQKLRIRFAEELKNTCFEIAKEIAEGAQVIQTSPSSSHG